jgi:DNA-binding beta-propeller fold protein YncE
MRILGQGFGSAGAACNSSGANVQVRLDQDSTGITCTVVGATEIDATVAASRLTKAHDFALDVVIGNVNSNTEDLYATGVISLKSLCSSAVMPEAVAMDSIANVGVITNYGCNSVSFINMDARNAHNYGVPYGSLLKTITVGKNPIGVDVIPRLGYAVVANNGDASASIIKYGGSPFTATQMAFTSVSCVTSSGSETTTNICTGVSPVGVTIDQDRALALIANTGGNSISAIDLTPILKGNTPPMQLVPTSGPPTAIAVDPNRAVAVVTNIQNAGTTSVTGGLDVINLATTPPSKTTTSSINTLSANPTGIVYDPVPNPALFYAVSTQQNAIYTFNPDSGSTTLIYVGVNPYSLAYNYQTGTMVSVNSTANTTSVIDAVNAPTFATRETLGISSQSQFAVAIDSLTNTAVMVDQNNDRALILPLPK